MSIDEHTIKCNTETRRNKEQVNNTKPTVLANPQIKTRNVPSRVANSITERNSYGLGYHNRQLDSRINPFQYAIEIKCLTLKDQISYVIPDG